MLNLFTNILADLVVCKNFSLKDSLEIISKKNKSIIGKTGNFLLENILQGTSLSSGMRRCTYINFDDIYISFINYAEKTGNLPETILFLQKRCKRKEENKSRLIESSVYPVIVISLSIIFCIYFKNQEYFKFSKDIFFYILLLILFSFILFICTVKIIGENKIYEAFLGIGFLLKAGICIYDAIGCGAQIVGTTSKTGIMFQRAREKLLFGMDLQHSFSMNKKYKDIFYYADKSGGKIDVFNKIAEWILHDDEKRRRICLSLIEPIFILIAGLFLIIIVINFVLPNISDISWIL